jgi:hypothetical protein
MRWFKHLSMAHDDVGLSTLLEAMGPEAYGIYWLLLEHFASVMEKDCTAVPELIHSEGRWAQICFTSARKFRKFAETAAELKLISSSSQAELKQFASRMPANRLQICIPKLLKYRDEYSRKSGQTPDKLPARTDTDGETDTDVDGEVSTFAQSDESLHASPPPVVALVPVPPQEPPMGTIPLVDGSNWPFTQEDVSGWCEAYPAVDVLQQLREFREWCKANPTKRKTRKGIRRAITQWLGSEQDKAGRPGGWNERTTATQRSLTAAGQYLETLRDSEGADAPEHPSPGGSLEGDLRRIC